MEKEKKDLGIRGEYIPSEQEHDILDMVYKRYQAMKESPDRVKAAADWDKWERQWEADRMDKQNSKVDDWQSNHYVPLTTAIVETALAEMVDQTPRPLILPRSSDDANKAQIMRHVFDYTWEVADGDVQLYNVMKDTLIYGTGIAQEYYLQDRRKVKKIEPEKGGKTKEIEEEVMQYDDCMLEVVKLQDFFVDEKARGFDGPYSARDCIRRYIMNIDDFNSFFSGEVWDPLGNAKYVKPGGDINYYEYYEPPTGIDDSKEVEVLWYWAVRPGDWLVVVANDVVIRHGPLPYNHKQLPFARSVDVKRVHRFYGKGESELLESIQDETNTLRRMILDRNHLDIDKMFLVSDTLNLNDEDLIARPHGMIPAGGDINSTKPIEYGDIPRSVELSLNALSEDAINVTGIDPRTASKPQPATATEAALLKEAALKKIRMKLRITEREFLVRVARLRVSNITQFYSDPILEKIVGEKGSQEYKMQLEELKASGQLMDVDGEQFKTSYREIPVDGKKIDINHLGEMTETAKPGRDFFTANPKFFTPSAKGGFDIKFAAGATLPISKPLLQTKTTEMYDRLIQLALGGIGYDPIKLGDALLKVNDFDPEEYKAVDKESSSAEEGFTDERALQLVELANQENQLMMQGEIIPPTGYASPIHTEIHVRFLNSPDFQEAQVGQDILMNFTKHISGELAAQTTRQAGQDAQAGMSPMSTNGNMPSFQGQGQQSAPPQTGGNTNNMMKQMIPGLIQGGGDTPAV